MKSIAIIGASMNREKFGNKAVRAYLEQGWKVFSVNPRRGEIEGQQAYKSILDIPHDIDRASLYLPPEIGIHILNELSLKNVKEVYLNPGTESEELENKAKELDLNIVKACSIVDIGAQPGNYN